VSIVPAIEELPVKNRMVDLVKSSKKEHPLAIAATGKSAIDKPGMMKTHNSDTPAEIKSSPTKNEDSKEKSVDKRELLYKCNLQVSCRLMPYSRQHALKPCQSMSIFPAPEEISPMLSHRVIWDDNFDQILMTTNAVEFDEPCIEDQEPLKQQIKKEDGAETHQQPKQDGIPNCQSPNFHETISSQVNNITSNVLGDVTHALSSLHGISGDTSLASTRLAGYFSTMSAESKIDAFSPECNPDSKSEEPSKTTGDRLFTTEREPPEQPLTEAIEPKTRTQPKQDFFLQYPPPHHQMGEPVDDIEVQAYFGEHKGGSVISCIMSATLHCAGTEESVEMEDVRSGTKSCETAQKELKIDGSLHSHSSTASESVEMKDLRSGTKSYEIVQKELKIDGSLHSHSSLRVSSEEAKSGKRKMMNFFNFSKLSKSNKNDDINIGNDKKQEEQKCVEARREHRPSSSSPPQPVISDKPGHLKRMPKSKNNDDINTGNVKKQEEKKCNEAPRKHHQSSSTPPPIISDKLGHLESTAPHGKTPVSPTQRKLFFAVETSKTKQAVASAKREFGIYSSYLLFLHELK
jgi:hypothetical protein